MTRSNLLLSLMVFGVCYTFATGAMASAFTAAYSPSSPTIDGALSPGEWGSAYNVTMDRIDGGGTHGSNLYFQHDETFLYVGVDSQWGTGWDVVWDAFIDGDHSGTTNGNLSQPYVDTQHSRPCPGGYPGYVAYRTVPGIGEEVRVPFGAAKSASGGSSNVFYEYKFPLADLGSTIPSGNDSVGFYLSHGYDGLSQHLYEMDGVSRTTPQDWATVELTTPNVALAANGGTATAESVGSYMGVSHPASLAIDGNYDTDWCNNWSIPTWVQSEFDHCYLIERVGVQVNYHQQTFSIDLSTDGVDWTEVVAPTLSGNIPDSVPTSGSAGPSYELFDIDPTIAKYMRVNITTTTAPSSHIFQAIVSEIEAYGSTVPGDANRDGQVGVADLGILATNYGRPGFDFEWEDADFTGDGIVDVSDLGVLAGNYGVCSTAGASVPEPSTFALIIMGALGLLAVARRQRR